MTKAEAAYSALCKEWKKEFGTDLEKDGQKMQDKIQPIFDCFSNELDEFYAGLKNDKQKLLCLICIDFFAKHLREMNEVQKRFMLDHHSSFKMLEP